MSVKRYALRHRSEHTEDPHGYFVRYFDYEHLAESHERLRTALETLADASRANRGVAEAEAAARAALGSTERGGEA